MNIQDTAYILISDKKNLTSDLFAQKLLKKVKLPTEPLKRNLFGRPYFANAYSLGWDISLSHSQDYFAGAIVQGRRIGIDCEIIQPIDLTPTFLNLVLCLKEAKYADKGQLQLEEFYDIWTCKEAISKALGIGLWLPFSEVSLDAPTQSLRKLSLLNGQEHLHCSTISSTENLKVAFAVISHYNAPCKAVLCHDCLH